MKTKTFSPLKVVLSALALPIAAGTLLAADLSDAFPTFDSYIKVSGQAASIRGDASAFQAYTGQSEFRDGVGIEDLHYAKDLNKTTSLTIDGRALSGSEDYLLGIKLVKAEVGSVDIGYKRFRTFYDGVGGFFPTNGKFVSVNQVYKNIPQNMFVDRGQFWAEVKIARPDSAEVTLRYVNETRDGRKDSTSWGDTDNTGLAYNASISPSRKIVPAYLDLSERHQLLEGSVKQTVGNTSYEARVFGDWVRNNDTRTAVRYPGEGQIWYATNTSPLTLAKANALAALNPLTQWTLMGNELDTTQYNGVNTATRGLDLHTSTDFGSKLTVRSGFAYEHVDNAFTADRPTWTATPYLVGVVQTNTLLYSDPISNVNGHNAGRTYTGSLAFDYKPIETLTITPGARIEDRVTDSSGTYTVVNSQTVNTTTGALIPAAASVPYAESSSVSERTATTDLNVRYTGVRDVALYGSATDRRTLDSQETFYAPYKTTAAAPIGNFNYAQPSEIHDDFKVGASWRQSSMLTLRDEVFYKHHTDKYLGGGPNGSLTNPQDTSVVASPGFTGYTGTNGYYGSFYRLTMDYVGNKFTAVVQPLPQLTLTSRYMYEQGAGHTEGYQLSTPYYPSMHSITNNIGETIDWNPTQQLYMQLSVDFVFNVIETVYPNAGTYPAFAGSATVPAQPAVNTNNTLQNSDNNYITSSFIIGSAITKRDDLQLQFTYYRATNSDSFLTQTVPFGVSETMVTSAICLKHKLTSKLMATGKVGYFESTNATTGYNTSFRGPMAYVSLDYGL